MKCPHCSLEIPSSEIAKSIGSEGGKKSRRGLTTEEAQAMVKEREKKKLARV